MNGMSGMCDRFLPAGLAAGRVIARVGLVSDTHMPARCGAFPAALFDAFSGVDMVLHAGDVGELWVLDALSTIAPVVAVHGNDDTEEATAALPYSQVVSAGGLRILLTHVHYPNRLQEMASRRDDAWGPKLERRATMAREAGAQVVVFGHTHVPMTLAYDGVLLVNPGALASGNNLMRQTQCSAAILFVRDDGVPFVQHIDLAGHAQACMPVVDWDAGFRAALAALSAPIITPALAADLPRLAALGRLIAPAQSEAAYMRLAHRCWAGELDVITHDDLLAELRQDETISLAAAHALASVLTDAPMPALLQQAS